MSVICPACGSAKIKADNELHSFEVPFGPAAAFLEVVYMCLSCGVTGDFTGENAAAIEKAYNDSIRASVVCMLDNLEKQGTSPAYFERALRLRPGVTKKWREGMISKEAVALLRLVYTFPNLLKVSDSNFKETSLS